MEDLKFAGRWVLRDGTEVTVIGQEGEGWVGVPGKVVLHWDKDGNSLCGDNNLDLLARVREAKYQ